MKVRSIYATENDKKYIKGSLILHLLIKKKSEHTVPIFTI